MAAKHYASFAAVYLSLGQPRRLYEERVKQDLLMILDGLVCVSMSCHYDPS